MTTDLDRALRSALGDIVAAAPEPDDQPMGLVTVGNEARLHRPYLAVASSLVMLAGVAALVAINTTDTTPAAAPIETDLSSTAVATTTTVPGETTSSVVVNTPPSPSCATTGAPALVPNVAGMAWVDATAVLTSAGLEPLPLPELPAPIDTPNPDLYVIIRQATAPGTITSCGTVVDVTVAYQPGILHIVQDGDTYESIAASQGITLEQLLGFNGLSVAELEASDRDSAAPLVLGQALRLGECPSSNAPAACSGPSSDLETVRTSIDPATLNATATTTTMP